MPSPKSTHSHTSSNFSNHCWFHFFRTNVHDTMLSTFFHSHLSVWSLASSLCDRETGLSTRLAALLSRDCECNRTAAWQTRPRCLLRCANKQQSTRIWTAIRLRISHNRGQLLSIGKKSTGPLTVDRYAPICAATFQISSNTSDTIWEHLKPLGRDPDRRSIWEIGTKLSPRKTGGLFKVNKFITLLKKRDAVLRMIVDSPWHCQAKEQSYAVEREGTKDKEDLCVCVCVCVFILILI